MNSRQNGFVNFGIVTLLIGGLVLAGKLIYDTKKARQLNNKVEK